MHPYVVGFVLNNTMRPICLACNQRPRAVAYHTNTRTQYRSRCEYCIKRQKKLPVPRARWQVAGYKKKTNCDRCGFRAIYASQLLVYHVDGNLNNNNLRNLKTVCQNCVVDINKTGLTWKPGDLEPDL